SAARQAATELEQHARRTPAGPLLRQVILGGQDGLVNVLGLVLGVASATTNSSLVMAAGLAGTFAESISMAAVAYTSSRAAQDHYKSEEEQEKWEMENIPEVEREEIRLIYMRKGFRGKTLDDIVKKITSNKKKWLETMMAEELGFGGEEKKINPLREAAVVGVSSFIGSVIPLAPFTVLPASQAMTAAVALAVVVLFGAGATKAALTVGKPLRSGLEMAGIGVAAAVAGYLVGSLFGVAMQ
ncbi:MAG: VIT1/CCC1 transporter family protein, partial [Candidatus Norongarragalinales archaeon]